MNQADITDLMDKVRSRLKQIEQEKKALETILVGSTSWMECYSVIKEVNIESAVSFPQGLEKVLKDAAGEKLTKDEIWERMQSLGVHSNAKRPTNYISLNVQGIDGVEEVEKDVYRWVEPSE